ncbi:MAG TPA: (5-formylfuran-3-yl)methyl phosphate synthase [Gemmataceae bacterium]|jgi:hypothetical protein|nr:(5-formylfuran-3-yl)methyl phosphate synthase [Gemmataceae bacterium]
MTQLLISVRNASEARVAVAGGADLIDVKEPSRGSLGQADFSIISEIAAIIGDQRPLSAALGELIDATSEPPAANFSFVKWGLSGCAMVRNWSDLLADRAAGVQRTNARCQAVGVAYADWRRAQSPSPADVCLAASRVHCAVVLVDTWIKDGSNLLAWLTPSQLIDLRVQCRALGLQLALAGGIDFDLLPIMHEIKPDWIGIRGAACTGGREGTLCADRVARLARVVHGSQ